MTKSESNKIVIWLIGLSFSIIISVISGSYVLFNAINEIKTATEINKYILQFHRGSEYNHVIREIERINAKLDKQPNRIIKRKRFKR